MIQGEFWIPLENGGELVLPNQFTIYGMQSLLKAAFWREELTWYAGLCSHNPADSIALANIREPTIGVNGYERAELPLTQENWAKLGTINGESYVETRKFSFYATGPYTELVNRLFLTDGTYVIAISSPMPDGLQEIDSDLLDQRYRLYFR